MTDINKDNLYLLLPGIVAGVARIYAEENGCSEIEAIRKIYSSELYPRLADESSSVFDIVFPYAATPPTASSPKELSC